MKSKGLFIGNYLFANYKLPYSIGLIGYFQSLFPGFAFSANRLPALLFPAKYDRL
jgi:hypothetical protein